MEQKGETVKKRTKRLNLSKETVRNLVTPAKDVDLLAVAGGSCNLTPSGPSEPHCHDR
jgi:hypothetical protein